MVKKDWMLQEALDYYRAQGAPADQNALISLLREVQQEYGGSIPYNLVEPIAQAMHIRETMIHALVRRIPSLRMGESHCLELCAGPNCGKAAALAVSAEKLAKQKGVTLKFVPCMRLCAKGPNLRWDGQLYHRADEALLLQLMNGNL